MSVIKRSISVLILMVSMIGIFGKTNTYLINPSVTYQSIDGFGASDAWSMRFVGLMPDTIQSRVADLLFSSDFDEKGNPKGIGLSIWRFNIGAGSLEQGDDSKINYSTRTECFLTDDGSYDWTKQLGQRRFLKLAKERKVPHLLGFMNSAPVYFTQNGLATNTGRGGDYNLKEDKYGDFAKFMADVIYGLKEYDGITLDYISPINEPDGHWNWQGPKQEGSPATNREIAKVARLLDNELTSRGLDTQIIIPESSDYRCMMSTHETDWQRGYEIQCFFSPDSTETYVGNLRHLPRMMAGHSYWTNTPVDNMKQIRMALNDTLKKYGVDFWQSEVCIMGNDEEIGGGHGYDRTMKTALYVARMIHHDLVYANARSWQWWRAVGGDYKDGLLFQYKDKVTGKDTIVDSKLLWTLGNYSRFIRPGAERIDISEINDSGARVDDSVTDPYGLMLSAFKNTDDSIVIVVINYSDEEKVFRVGFPTEERRITKGYYTSDAGNQNLSIRMLNPDEEIKIPSRTILTLTEK